MKIRGEGGRPPIGAYLTTAQSAAFMLMQSADHPNFKAVSKLVIEHIKKPNEFNEIARE